MIVELLYAVVYYGIAILIGIATAAIVYARWNYGKLENVKGLHAIVKPGFIGGSCFNLHKHVVHEMDSDNVRKQGKIYGFYEGRTPEIFLADPELIRLIFMKDFDHFQDKRQAFGGHELIAESIDFLKYEKWKLVRTSISPTFTTGKIKSMGPPMIEAIENWLAALKKKVPNKSESFKTKQLFMPLTVDIFAKCVFGVQLNSLDDPNSEFMQQMKKMDFDFEPSVALGIIQTFPIIADYVPLIPHEVMHYFRDLCLSFLKTRKDSGVRMNDFVDCLNDMKDKIGKDPEYIRLKMSENTIAAQALAFLVAGFETSATTLSMLSYILATHSDVQQKLIQEVDEYLVRNKGKIEHDTIGELKYMSACIMEVLRLFPSLVRIERECTKEWYHEPTGLRIPKGMTVQVPCHYVHYDKDNYEEPEKFKAERFLPENKDKLNPCTFLGFGLGNHNCMGMRMGKEIVSLALTNTLKTFEFRKNEGTKLVYKKGSFFATGIEPFTVDFVRRDQK